MGALVFKIMPPSATFHGVDYNEKKLRQGVANLVHFQNFGHLQFGMAAITKDEFKQYLKDYSGMNSRIRNPQFHAILSSKGRQFTHDQLKGYALTMMEKLGYGNNPMLIYAHNDTKHNHIHIVTSRVAPDGSKVDHRFEGLRANTILNELLGVNAKQEFQTALKNAMQYRVSTPAQFNLLMEKAGYTVQPGKNAFSYFKHGTLQGTVSTNKVEEKIRQDLIRPSRIAQVKAVVQQYKSAYPALLHYVNFMTPEAKPRFTSELTDFLNGRFDLEFVFFTGKDKTTPYGYAVIDHQNKEVHKGGDVMKLQEMQARPEALQLRSAGNSHQHEPQATYDPSAKDHIGMELVGSPAGEADILSAIGSLMNEEITALEKDLKDGQNIRKRKKARVI